jgi:hypothetical protein
VAVVGGLAYAILSAVASGPPTFTDPLTGSWTYTIGPGNSSVLGGSIVGEDYIEGHFLVTEPPGAVVLLSIFNQTGFHAWRSHLPTSPVGASYNGSDTRIVFPAPYTDTFYFVFTNPYPASSGIVLTVQVTTHYESNVVLG